MDPKISGSGVSSEMPPLRGFLCLRERFVGASAVLFVEFIALKSNRSEGEEVELSLFPDHLQLLTLAHSYHSQRLSECKIQISHHSHPTHH